MKDIQWEKCFINMKIGIYTNKNKDINFEVTSKLISLGILENIEIESAIPNKKYDILISLGGDGTLLSVAKNNIDIPIIGINTGHLGYLTVSNKDNLQQILKTIKAGEIEIEERILIEGSFENVPSININSNCEIISENGARICFAKDSFFNVQNSSLKIYNCVIEQNFANFQSSFSQQNLFKLNNSSLIVDNCEIVSLYKNNGSVIFADNSDLTILNSGITGILTRTRFPLSINRRRLPCISSSCPPMISLYC